MAAGGAFLCRQNILGSMSYDDSVAPFITSATSFAALLDAITADLQQKCRGGGDVPTRVPLTLLPAPGRDWAPKMTASRSPTPLPLPGPHFTHSKRTLMVTSPAPGEGAEPHPPVDEGGEEVGAHAYRLPKRLALTRVPSAWMLPTEDEEEPPVARPREGPTPAVPAFRDSAVGAAVDASGPRRASGDAYKQVSGALFRPEAPLSGEVGIAALLGAIDSAPAAGGHHASLQRRPAPLRLTALPVPEVPKPAPAQPGSSKPVSLSAVPAWCV